jgi:hypothetical protein
MKRHSRTLSSTAPRPLRPATNSSKPGMQNVFCTSTSSSQIFGLELPAGSSECVPLAARVAFIARDTFQAVWLEKSGRQGHALIYRAPAIVGSNSTCVDR